MTLNSSHPKRTAWWIAAIIATLLFSIPLFMLLAVHGDHLPFAHETLQFRYFTNVRILNGEGGAIYLPQGQLLTTMQHAILLSLRAVSGYSFFDLRPMLNWYAVATNAVTVALYGCVALAAALDRRLTWFDRMIVMAIGPFVMLTTGAAGFYYTLLPDYYALDEVIVAASVYFALALFRDQRSFRWRNLIAAGIFCGIATSNKLTLLGPAGIVAVIAAVRSPISIGQFFLRGTAAGLLAITGFLGVFLFCYLGQPGEAIIALRSWLSFLSSIGAESNFWDQNALVFWRGYHYDLIAYCWIFGTVSLVVAISWCRQWISRSSLVLAASVVVALLLVAGLIKRGSGTTAFEMATIVTGLTAIVLTVAMGNRPRWQFGIPIIVIAAWFAARHFDFAHNLSVVSRSGGIAERSWQIHDYIEQVGGPSGETLVVVPDFSYLWNGVEDLIAFGMLDKAGTPGAAIRDHSPFRPIRFVAAVPSDVSIGDVIVTPIKYENGASLPIDNPSCRSWLTGYDERVVVRVCPASQTEVALSR